MGHPETDEPSSYKMLYSNAELPEASEGKMGEVNFNTAQEPGTNVRSPSHGEVEDGK